MSTPLRRAADSDADVFVGLRAMDSFTTSSQANDSAQCSSLTHRRRARAFRVDVSRRLNDVFVGKGFAVDASEIHRFQVPPAPTWLLEHLSFIVPIDVIIIALY
jgi:hypothetical protein